MEGLPRSGSMDLDRKAAGKLQGSQFPAAAARHGADKQTTRAVIQSLHLTQRFPSQGSQQGTRMTAAFVIQEHAVTHRKHEMLWLHQCLPSPHLSPATLRQWLWLSPMR